MGRTIHEGLLVEHRDPLPLEDVVDLGLANVARARLSRCPDRSIPTRSPGRPLVEEALGVVAQGACGSRHDPKPDCLEGSFHPLLRVIANLPVLRLQVRQLSVPSYQHKEQHRHDILNP